MATFTFSSGNAQGLRRIPLYLLGALATLLVPRTRKVWVFGSGIGPGEGALPLYRLARQRLGRDVRLVWLATTERELGVARDLGLDAVPKLGLRGFWLTMRAQVLVVTHGQGDVNRYGARGGLLVQLWHGIPLKRLHLDSPAALESTVLRSRRLGAAIIRRGFRAVGRQIDLFPVSSEHVADRIVGAFGLRPDVVAVTGDPRDDVLLQGSPTERRARARRSLTAAVGPIDDATRIVMYAPTWREGDPDPAAPTEAVWGSITTWLDKVDAVLIVRSHPLGVGDYADGPRRSDRVRLLDATMIADLTPLLPAVDHLVTDYSSVAYDFALTGGSTVYLAADVMTYTSTRGLYEPYVAFSGGRDVAGWPDALAVLDDLVAGVPEAVAAAEKQRNKVLDEHFDFLDGRATERVFDRVLRLVTASGAGDLEAPRGRVRVVAARFTDEHLRVDLDPRDAPIGSGHLDGPRERVEGVVSDDGATLTFPLTVERWGRLGLALPSGRYAMVVHTVDGEQTRRLDLSTAALPTDRLTDLCRVALLSRAGSITLVVEPPLTDDERRPRTQRRLHVQYLLARGRRENAVYFESFFGRTVGDNPAAIERVLARRHPEIHRYWSVADRSVPVPSGSVALVERSTEWWRVRADARVLVVNDWLRWSFRPRPGQKVLQTWHGTMLKRLALDRSGRTLRQRLAARRQGFWWDAVLAQNDYSEQNFRTAYAYRGPVWVDGYPRNDQLHDLDRRAEVRALLGLPDGVRAVLYVPTWRDDRDDLVDHLDLAEFVAALPAGIVLLVRGHSRTLGHGRDLHADRLVDVTTYPDVADLLLAADVLVTDYSSVMFDFAATGKPMVFFTPDIDHYADVLRGFYFDLVAVAPGPVVQTRDQLAAAVTDPDAHADQYAQRYLTWQRTFAPLDDGQAAERVVDHLVDRGWLD